MNHKNASGFKTVYPSGVCQMGSTEVTYYRLTGDRLWFDKKAIERVLTGKNQNNILGADKDPRNHGKIFDMKSQKVTAVISKTGVGNYLKNARSVNEENRHVFYTGVNEIENPREVKEAEQLQIPMFTAETPQKIDPFVKIIQKDKGTEVYCAANGNDLAMKNNELVQMLLSVAQGIMTGTISVMATNEAA